MSAAGSGAIGLLLVIGVTGTIVATSALAQGAKQRRAPMPQDTTMSQTFAAPICGLTVTLTRGAQPTMMLANQPTMPDLQGQRIDEALQFARGIGGVVTGGRVRNQGDVGTIVSQAPPTGTRMLPGDSIALCWRLPETWPLVVGRTTDAAISTLADSGYRAVQLDSLVPADSAAGLVLRQQPQAGTAADSGGTDTLFVAVHALAQDNAGADTAKKPVDTTISPDVGPVPPAQNKAWAVKIPATLWLLIFPLVVLGTMATVAARSWIRLNAIGIVARKDSGSQVLTIGRRPPALATTDRASSSAERELDKLGFSVTVVAGSSTQHLRIP